MSLLITGGAGYIGSHMAYAALERGEAVVVLDNLSTGVRALVPREARFYQGQVDDTSLVRRILQDHTVNAVLHFAGSTVVPESVADPLSYYANNTMVSRALIEACIQANVKSFVFSSTAAVYGMPEQNPVAENAPTLPINPYGRSKLMIEWMLEDAAKAYDFRYVALRYFNVAGADPKGRAGQSTPKATHLIRRACQVALGRIPVLEIFGTDFPTPDGTGVRDYIHVCDLVAVHWLVLDYLRAGGASATLNCGYGHGYSVHEVIEAVLQIAGHKTPTRESPRRPGDPAAIVADSSKLRTDYHWRPEHDDLHEIVRTAYEWERCLSSV